MNPPIRLYRFPLSGHSHRVELLLSLMGLPFERVEVDLVNGEHKRAEFLAKNVFGQVPVIENGEITLADSNAILVYLAARYDAAGRWLPRDATALGAVQRWLSVAAGPLAHGPSAARLVKLFAYRLEYDQAARIAAQLFAVLEGELGRRPFLVGAAPTIADVALYTYTAHAPEGGISLEPYPNLRAWLARIEGLPGFVPMARAPVAAAV